MGLGYAIAGGYALTGDGGSSFVVGLGEVNADGFDIQAEAHGVTGFRVSGAGQKTISKGGEMNGGGAPDPVLRASSVEINLGQTLGGTLLLFG